MKTFPIMISALARTLWTYFFFREGGRTMETMAKRKIAALNSILISVLIFSFFRCVYGRRRWPTYTQEKTRRLIDFLAPPPPRASASFTQNRSRNFRVPPTIGVAPFQKTPPPKKKNPKKHFSLLACFALHSVAVPPPLP